MEQTKPLTLIDSIRAMRARDEHLGISIAFAFDRPPRDIAYRTWPSSRPNAFRVLRQS